jgi:hypothetical protein
MREIRIEIVVRHVRRQRIGQDDCQSGEDQEGKHGKSDDSLVGFML